MSKNEGPFNKIPLREQILPLKSAVVDARTGRVVLFSKMDDGTAVQKGGRAHGGPSSASLREKAVLPEDLASVLSVRLFDDDKRAPSFSLDPADPKDPSGPRTRATFMPEKGVRDTFLGQMLYEADHHLKHRNFGVKVKEDGSLARLRSSVEGFRATSDIRFERLKKAHAEGKLTAEELAEPSYNRKWIVVNRASEEEEGDTLHFRSIEMGVDTRVMVPDATARMGLRDVESADDPDSNEFCARFAKHYDELVAEAPQLGHVREMTKLVGLVDWIEERGWAVNLSRLEEVLKRCSANPTTREIRTVSDRQRGSVGDAFITQVLVGGVDMAVCKDKTQTQGPEHAAIMAAGKYTEGTVGIGALAGIDELEAALAASPEDSPEAAALKAQMREEIAKMRRDIADGKPITDADVAAFGDRLAAMAAEAAAQPGAPDDIAPLSAAVAGLGAGLAAAAFSRRGDPAGVAAAEARAGAIGADLAAALRSIADRGGLSATAAGGIQKDLAAVLAGYPGGGGGGGGGGGSDGAAAAMTAEQVAKLIDDAGAVKDLHALVPDADTAALVAEVESLLAAARPGLAAAAAAAAAGAAAIAAANRSRNDDAVAALGAHTTSQYDDDPEDAQAFRAELAALLASSPAAREGGDAATAAETDKFLADLRALEVKHGAAAGDKSGLSEDLVEALEGVAAIRAGRAAAVAGRTPDEFVEAVRHLVVPATNYPVDRSKEAADLRAAIAAALARVDADAAAAGGAYAEGMVRSFAAILLALVPMYTPSPGAEMGSASPQLIDLLNALCALLGLGTSCAGLHAMPGMIIVCGAAGGGGGGGGGGDGDGSGRITAAQLDAIAAAASGTADGGKADAQGLKAELDAVVKAALVKAGKGADEGGRIADLDDEALAMLAQDVMALSIANPPVSADTAAAAGMSEQARQVRGAIAALAVGSAGAGKPMSPDAFVQRARDVGDPAKTDPMGSERATKIQEEVTGIVAAMAGGEGGRTHTPEDIAVLRGGLIAVAKRAREAMQKDPATLGADKGFVNVLSNLEALVAAAVVTSSQPPHDATIFAGKARCLGDKARTPIGGASAAAGELQADIASAVAASDASLSGGGARDQETGLLLYTAAECDRLADALRAVLRKHTPRDGSRGPDDATDTLRGMLSSLLQTQLPGGDGNASAGPSGTRLRGDLNNLADGVGSGAPEDAKDLAGYVRGAAALVPDVPSMTHAEAMQAIATLESLADSRRPKDGDAEEAMSAEAKRVLRDLDAIVARLKADTGAAEAARRAAVTAGVTSALAAAVALAGVSEPSAVIVGDLYGESLDLLRCGQFARGTLVPGSHGKRGGARSRFGANPRFLVRDVDDGLEGPVQLVLTLAAGTDLAACGRPYLYVFRVTKEGFAPCVEWWSNDNLSDAKMRVQDGGRKVRVDLPLLASNEALIAIPCVDSNDFPAPIDFTLTVHSGCAMEVSPLRWVPKNPEDRKVDIATARGDAAAMGGADVTQTKEWHTNTALRVKIGDSNGGGGGGGSASASASGVNIAVLLRMDANTGAGVRIDLARSLDPEATCLGAEGTYEIVDPSNPPSYDALPEMHRRFKGLEPGGCYFVVPSVLKGAEGKFTVEVWGAPGTFTCSAPSANALGEVAHVEHDAKVVPAAIGLQGWEEI